MYLLSTIIIAWRERLTKQKTNYFSLIFVSGIDFLNLGGIQFLFNPAGIYKQTSGLTSGGSLAVSSNGTANAILWAVGNDKVFRALDAADVTAPPFWTSAQNSVRDAPGVAGHLVFPTVVAGKMYVPNKSARIVVYGLLATLPVAVAQINCGGGAASPFVADMDFSGGQTAATAAAIDTSGVVNPAPQAVYQSQRLGRFTYVIPGLKPGQSYTVRLHFAETVDKAVTQSFTGVATPGGLLALRFAAAGNSPDPNALLCGLEVLH